MVVSLSSSFEKRFQFVYRAEVRTDVRNTRGLRGYLSTTMLSQPLVSGSESCRASVCLCWNRQSTPLFLLFSRVFRFCGPPKRNSFTAVPGSLDTTKVFASVSDDGLQLATGCSFYMHAQHTTNRLQVVDIGYRVNPPSPDMQRQARPQTRQSQSVLAVMLLWK